jgi:hypothetical protein
MFKLLYIPYFLLVTNLTPIFKIRIKIIRIRAPPQALACQSGNGVIAYV